MAPLVFEVVAEFQMRAGSAVLQSRQLEAALDGVSGSAQRALDAVNGLGASLAASFGLGSLSAIGGISKAIQVSEKFNATVTNFSSIITSNKEVFAGNVFDDFNKRVSFSSQLVRELSEEANRLGVREATLFNTFKSIGFIGLQGGLQVDEIKKLAANVQLAAPVTGLDPSLVGDQIFRLALQGVSGSPRLFKTLLADTQTFNRFKGEGGVREFGQLDFAARVKLLSEAFKEFGNKPEILARQLNSINAQMSMLANQMTGLDSGIRKVGDVLTPIFIEALRSINIIVGRTVNPVLMELAETLEFFKDSPIEIIRDLKQIAGLSRDLDITQRIVQLIPQIFIMSGLFKLLNVRLLTSIPLMGGFIKAMDVFFGALATRLLTLTTGFKSFGAFAAAFSGVGFGGKILVFGKILIGVIARFALLGTILIIFLQTLRRAADTFKLVIVDFFERNAVRLANLGKRFAIAFNIILSPFQGFIESVGEALGGAFGTAATFLLDILITLGEALARVAEGFATFVSAINGLVAAMAAAVATLFEAFKFAATGRLGAAKDALSGIGENMGEAFIDELKKNPILNPQEDRELPVNPQVVHTGDVVINNDIKEAFEPDRIAFTVTEQIAKALTNGRSAAGNPLNQTGSALIAGE